jgi:hypothetical protein
MSRYAALLAAVVALGSLYASLADPCNRRVRLEFAQRHPGFVILGSGAAEGSPASVRCRVSYRRPGDDAVYEDVWRYQRPRRRGWELAGVLEAGTRRQPPR